MRDLINIILMEDEQQFALTPQVIKQLKQWRHECRIENGGGGACHLVSEIIQDEWGFERAEGTYVAPDGRVICPSHLWNYTPDGSILDATADQFSEDVGIRLIRPTDPLFQRYRVVYRDQDTREISDDELEITRAQNDRENDEARASHGEHGPAWWTSKKKLYQKYASDQMKHYGHDILRHYENDA